MSYLMNLYTLNKTKCLLFCCIVCSSIVPSFWQQVWSWVDCDLQDIVIQWPMITKPNQNNSYNIVTNSVLDEGADAEYELWQSDTLIQTSKGILFEKNFVTTGNFVLKWFLRRSMSCVKVTSYPIVVSDALRLSLWLPTTTEPVLDTLAKQYRGQFLFLRPAEKNSNDHIVLLRQLKQTLPYADALFVEAASLQDFLWYLKSLEIYSIPLPKTLVVVWNLRTSAVKRLVWQVASYHGIATIAVVAPEYLTVAVQAVVNGTALQTLKTVRLVNLDTSMRTRWLPMSRMVDNLIQQWVDLSFLVLLLTLPVLVLLLVFLKQVLWVQVGWVYYVLLIAIMSSLLWWQTASLMFFVAWIAQQSMYLLTKKLYLLYAPKIWFAAGLTAVLCLLLYYLSYRFLPIFASQLVSDPTSVLFPLLTLSLMMQYITPNLYDSVDKNRWLGFLQFILAVICCHAILHRAWLQQFILWFPDAVVLVLLSIVLLWRYAWLQLSEYIRFWPLIEQYFKDEE